MKAWVVEPKSGLIVYDDDNESTVAFAETEEDAVAAGWPILIGGWDPEDLVARREPKFDGEKLPTWAQLLENGWWVTCERCFGCVSPSDADEGPAIVEGPLVYCSDICRRGLRGLLLADIEPPRCSPDCVGPAEWYVGLVDAGPWWEPTPLAWSDKANWEEPWGGLPPR
ncbi:MAG: hypothetical protein NTZ05_16655, partial [Chloroflexi bacterium]|nr:hypothetical protein [Chloroflexota bacterium]